MVLSYGGIGTCLELFEGGKRGKNVQEAESKSYRMEVN